MSRAGIGWRSEWDSLVSAVQFFTRVRVPGCPVTRGAAQLSGAVRYFPAIGIAVGAVGALVFWASVFVFPPAVAVLLSMAATAWLTGAFHEDGLADTFDGLGASATRERALQIMKDPRVGTFGALALLLVLLLKLFALAGLPAHETVAALVAAHALSRWCATAIVWRLKYAREHDDSARSREVVQGLRNGEFAFATLCGFAPLLLLNVQAIVALAAVVLTVVYLARWFTHRLGGYTGDVLGATQQLTEVVFYLSLLAT